MNVHDLRTTPPAAHPAKPAERVPPPAEPRLEAPDAPVNLSSFATSAPSDGVDPRRLELLRPVLSVLSSLDRLALTEAPRDADRLLFRSSESPLVALSVAQLNQISERGLDGVRADTIPRQPLLTHDQRVLETKFVDLLAYNPVEAVSRYRAMVGRRQVFEVDLAKHLVEDWGAGKSPANDTERFARSMGNVALHGTAQVVTALAFLQRLDELALMTVGSPEKQVLVTLGPVAAGKSQLINLLKASDRLNFGAILDAAGEGHAFDAHWVFTECQKRDLPLMVACCVNEPQVGGLIDRALNIGRLPDAMTFCASYEQMPIAATHFFGRGDVRAALREGRLDAMGIHPGQFDKRSLTEPGKFMPFPDLRVLNKDSDGALVVPTGPSPRAVMEDKIDRLAQANLPEYLLQAALIGTVLWRDAAIDWVPPDLSQLAGWRT